MARKRGSGTAASERTRWTAVAAVTAAAPTSTDGSRAQMPTASRERTNGTDQTGRRRREPSQAAVAATKPPRRAGILPSPSRQP